MDFKKIKFQVIRNIYWDDWGRLILVFRKGDICDGELYSNGIVCAESPYYKDICDVVDLMSIKIL